MTTLNEIRTANDAADGHFFDADTIRFFNSVVYKNVYEGPGGIYFVTSERYNHSHPRFYTVRTFNPETGDIHTAGEFQDHATLAAANSAAKALAR
jgi:hypothetical protein